MDWKTRMYKEKIRAGHVWSRNKMIKGRYIFYIKHVTVMDD